MTDFRSLDPETRAFALIGQFLQRWAAMESNLHDCIQTAFKLTPTMTHILCANLKVYDKLNILRTIIDVAAIDPASQKITFTKLLRRIGTYSGHRNIIAHNPFQADSAGQGVSFVTVKARGKYEASNVVWTEKKFAQEGCIVDTLKQQLSALNAQLIHSPIRDEAYRLALAEALRAWEPRHALYEFRHTMSPALIDHLSRQPPAPPDSDPANEETSPQKLLDKGE